MTDDATTRFRDLTLDDFTARLSSAAPVPGGGSASAVAASLGASLVAMVASLSEGRPRYADHTDLLIWARDTCLALADRFLAIADEDAAAYALFDDGARTLTFHRVPYEWSKSAALKLPKDTEAEQGARRTALQAAARTATEVPLACVDACITLVGAAEALAGRSNVNASSDLAVASLLGEAAARGAAANVMINLPSVGDPDWEGTVMLHVTASLDEVERLASSARQAVAEGTPRDPLDPPAPS